MKKPPNRRIEHTKAKGNHSSLAKGEGEVVCSAVLATPKESNRSDLENRNGQAVCLPLLMVIDGIESKDRVDGKAVDEWMRLWLKKTTRLFLACRLMRKSLKIVSIGKAMDNRRVCGEEKLYY